MNNAIYNEYVSDESALYNQTDVFFNMQAKYAINASMMYALALNESGLGLSQYALEYHNLFGHAAIDENPDNANQYKSIANPNDSRYHGSWFGDKASGINVNYASDPYWGEKAASFYYHLDEDGIDQEKNPIKTIQLSKDLKVYAPNKKDVFYTYKKGSIVSIHILEEERGYYKIASEAPIKNNHLDIKAKYKNSHVYIKKSDFK